MRISEQGIRRAAGPGGKAVCAGCGAVL